METSERIEGTPPADPLRLDRRTAIRWMLAASAGVALARGMGQIDLRVPGSAPSARDGYGTDPDIIRTHAPGDFWPLTLTRAERRAVSALCDVIIPADDRSPSASALHVPDFIDEWISAPYAGHGADRTLVNAGLAWLDAESRRRYGSAFARATDAQRLELCEAMAPEAPPKSELELPSKFFRRVRNLTMVGFFTTPAGMKDLGYVGNVPLARFEGPPADLIARLGLADEVAW